VVGRAGRPPQATPGTKGGTLAGIESANAVVIAGQSLEESAPVMWLRVLKAVRHGVKLVSGVSADEAARAVGDAARVALVWDGLDLEAGRAFASALAGIADLTTYIAGEQGNARGAEAMGMFPAFGPGYASVDAGRSTQGMLEDAGGKLSALSIFGANPVLNGFDSAATAEALGRLDFLAVSDLFMTETARCATLILPAKGTLEKSGTTINLAGDLLPVNRSLEAPEGVLSDLEMLIGLADQLGVPMPAVEELDRSVITHAAKAQPAFTLGDEAYAMPAFGENVEPGEPKTIFSGGGTSSHDPTIATLRRRSNGVALVEEAG
jgi:predicted molibdopterin-dependent oxidoreductase YjgC